MFGIVVVIISTWQAYNFRCDTVDERYIGPRYNLTPRYKSEIEVLKKLPWEFLPISFTKIPLLYPPEPYTGGLNSGVGNSFLMKFFNNGQNSTVIYLKFRESPLWWWVTFLCCRDFLLWDRSWSSLHLCGIFLAIWYLMPVTHHAFEVFYDYILSSLIFPDCNFMKTL